MQRLEFRGEGAASDFPAVADVLTAGIKKLLVNVGTAVGVKNHQRREHPLLNLVRESHWLMRIIFLGKGCVAAPKSCLPSKKAHSGGGCNYQMTRMKSGAFSP